MANAPAATVTWLEALPPGGNRDRLIERALDDGFWRLSGEALFSSDQGVAMRLFGQLPEDSQLRLAAALSRGRIQKGELTGLNEWVQTFPSESVRAEVCANTLGELYTRDASRVEPFLAEIHGTREHDAALRSVSRVMTASDPPGAAARAMQIGDAAIRREALGNVMTSWLKAEPERATEWLSATSEIPAAWKQSWKATE